MLWAQPEHFAFAVLEAEDVEAALQYIGALVPQDWTSAVLPVWNLPSQLRLIRQVQLAPTMLFADALATEPVRGSSEVVAAEATTDTQPSVEATSADAVEEPVVEAASDPSAHQTWPQHESDSDSPGTITRMLEELDSSAEETQQPTRAGDDAHPAPYPSAEQATQIEAFAPADQSPARVRAWLVATNGPAKGSRFPVAPEGASVGRLPENSVYIPDERLSREHARIDFRDGTFMLSDLGSRNGTALNGTLLSAPQPLNNGDTIELGSNTLVVTIEAEPEA
jgi:hypothetical protein